MELQFLCSLIQGLFFQYLWILYWLGLHIWALVKLFWIRRFRIFIKGFFIKLNLARFVFFLNLILLSFFQLYNLIALLALKLGRAILPSPSLLFCEFIDIACRFMIFSAKGRVLISLIYFPSVVNTLSPLYKNFSVLSRFVVIHLLSKYFVFHLLAIHFIYISKVGWFEPLWFSSLSTRNYFKFLRSAQIRIEGRHMSIYLLISLLFSKSRHLRRGWLKKSSLTFQHIVTKVSIFIISFVFPCLLCRCN